jgi:hypothetical protein
MDEERKRILGMLQDGKINADEAEKLLDALGAEKQVDALETEAQRLERGNTRSMNNYGKMMIDRQFLEGLQGTVAISNYGKIFIDENTPTDLLAQKIAAYTNYGKTFGTAAVLSMLQSCCKDNYGEFIRMWDAGSANEDTEDDDDDEEEECENESRTRSNLGELILTQAYLSRLPDGTKFENLGKLKVGPDVSEDLLQRKIGRYDNLGITYGPKALLSILQSRCNANLGRFEQTEPEEAAAETEANGTWSVRSSIK